LIPVFPLHLWRGLRGRLGVHEWEKADDAGDFDLSRYFALVTCTQTAALAWNDLSKRGNEAAEDISILIIDVRGLVHTEVAIAIFFN
jgi:hypothetical protein